MKYREGFKYQLVEQEEVNCGIIGRLIESDFYTLVPDGTLVAKVGFAWDGASGSFDTNTNMRASMFHDIICLMVARGQLPKHYLENQGNVLFRRLLKEDGMNAFRRWYHFEAVEVHFRRTDPERRKVLTAP